MYGLILFCLTILSNCNPAKEHTEIAIQWKDKKAVGVVITEGSVKIKPVDSLSKNIQVRLLNQQNAVAILGEFAKKGESIIFTPLIPFTRGLKYEVRTQSQQIGTFEIPRADPADAPEVLAIYPSADTLPENLLKIHVYFSKPMRESQSGRYVTLVKNNTDTIMGAFLDLQPELWNEDRTMLTLWLDPGRIKKDLIPNKLLGAPMQKNNSYKIILSSSWPDQKGLSLKTDYVKNFVTTTRDTKSPIPNLWVLRAPSSGSRQALTVDFKEELDYSLLQESLAITNENGAQIPGKWEIISHEKCATFTPEHIWYPGSYFLRVETRLEDLSGNNLNRPFERDITKGTARSITGRFMTIPFRIQD